MLYKAKTMDNTNIISDNVKWFSDFFTLLRPFFVGKDYICEKNLDKCDYSSWFSNYTQVLQSNCSLRVPAIFAWNPNPNCSSDTNKRKVYNQLYFIRKALREGTLHDEELKDGLRIINNSVKAFSFLRDDGKRAFFTSYTKGTVRYGKKQAAESQDYIQNHVNAGWESFFYTLTCDPKKYANRYDAWKNYKKREVMPALETLRKHHGLEYIGFMESTEKGYPHIHIVMFFPKGTIAGYDKMKSGQVLYYGKLFNYLRRRQNSIISKLIALKGDNVKYYLTKYVTKESESNVLQLESKKGAFTKSERKLALGLVITKACAIRTKVCCKDRTIPHESDVSPHNRPHVLTPQSFISDFMARQKLGTLSPRDFARLRAYLIKLCTNSPLTCGHCISVMSYRKFYSLFNADCSSVDANCEKNNLLFQKNSKTLSCGGCFFRSLMDLLSSNQKNIIKNGVNYEKSDTVLAPISERINKGSSVEWFQCVSELLDFYLGSMCSRGVSYRRVKIGEMVNGRVDASEFTVNHSSGEVLKPGNYECVIDHAKMQLTNTQDYLLVWFRLIHEKKAFPTPLVIEVKGFVGTDAEKTRNSINLRELCNSLGLTREEVLGGVELLKNRNICVCFQKNYDGGFVPSRFTKSIFS